MEKSVCQPGIISTQGLIWPVDTVMQHAGGRNAHGCGLKHNLPVVRLKEITLSNEWV